MELTQARQSSSILRPRPHALALEPRIMFDGAAATAADQHHNEGSGTEAAVSRPASTSDPATRAPASAAPAAAGNSPATAPSAPAAQAPALNLVVVDARLENHEQLTAGLPGNTRLLVVDNQTDGLAAISAALAQLGHVDSIQIFSHGSAGQFTLGNSTIDAATLQRSADVLASWRAELNAGADIQLYGCDIGAGNAGQTLVKEMAQLTGADVGASSDATGNASAGGNWTLEVVAGTIDKTLALNAASVSAYDSLLDNAAPTVTMGSASSDVLLGDQVSFVVNFTNNSTQVGFAPFIDLFMPATGKDGDDGVSFVSATYLGQSVNATVVTFDASGNATHPFARDASGNPVIVTAASVGMRPGDQMVVLEVPFGSVANDQPVISINVTARLSNLADTAYSNGAPDLGVQARGGFQYGNDALNNPKQDPSLIGATLASFTVHPTVLTFTETINAPEGETATGPNFGRTLTVTATPAPGQTLTNVEVQQALPPTMFVTGITPGSGGTVTSITLHDRTVLTDPTEIADALAAGTYLDAFTVSYPSLAASTSTVVNFYVPEVDANGAEVIDDATGAPRPITVAGAQATGEWIPLDPRDLTAPDPSIDFSATGQDSTFVARSIAVIKRATVQVDTGHTGLTPGDTMAYQLDVTISDFFAFGRTASQEGLFILADRLSDGQTLAAAPTMTFSVNGVSTTIALVYTATVNADGSTALALDIGQSLANTNALRPFLAGDLAFDALRQGATLATINYTAVVGQSYTPPAGAPHSEINEGDSLGNNAQVTAAILDTPVSINGQSQSDTSATSSTVPTSTVDIQLVSVNGGAVPANGELRPGDLVTFRMNYDLVTGDYESFQLAAYLPQPLFNLAGITWANGTGNGQWILGTGNSNDGPVVSVTSGSGNSVVFNFGDYVTPGTGTQIQVEFTLRVGDQPFADQRALSVLGMSSQFTTLTNVQLTSADAARISSIAEPVLDITHGVVSSSHGSVTGTTGTWAAPGSGGVPFSGSVTQLAAIEGNASGIDAGDIVRLASAIENSGGGGAYDVETSITLPAGLNFVGGSLATANVLIYRGDGTPLVLGQDFSISGNTITFLDANNQATLLAGRAGTANDLSGANVVVITYDTVVIEGIAASTTMRSTGTLSHYASVEGGADFTPTDLTDTADQQVAAPSVIKQYAGGTLTEDDSSAAHTTGSDLVVGESMLYDIVVTLPEGNTLSLVLNDLVPGGLRVDTSFNGGLGYQLITAAGAGTSLPLSFDGTVAVSSFAAASGTLGNDGVAPRWTFSAAHANGNANIAEAQSNNSFVIRVRLVASNTTANQAGQARNNSASLVYTDPDGDTPNGTATLDRNVALTGAPPSIVIREPTLQITQTLVTPPGFGFDDGDSVTWTITISNGTAGTDFDAFDISLLNLLPTQLSGITLGSVTYAGGATNNGGPDFVVDGTQLATAAGANIDIVRGGSITITLTGVVNASAPEGSDIPNTATVQWTSLNGTQAGAADPAGERTGVDGLLDSGALNDYRRASTLNIPVAEGIRFSRVGGLPDTPAPAPTDAPSENVAIGEIVRYRAAVLVPEGNSPNYQLQLVLDPGLEFILPSGSVNNVNIGLVSNGAPGSELVSSATLTVGGTPIRIVGNEDSDEVQLITADLSGLAPQGIFDPSRITVTTVNGRQVVTFDLGNLSNPPNDSDLEGVVVEFNVRVANVAAAVANAQLGLTVNEIVNGFVRGSSDTLYERVVEPSFNGLTNRVIDFNPNPGGNSGTATFQVDFTQNGGLSAFDTRLTVNYAEAQTYQLVSVTIGGTTYDANNLPAGVTAIVAPTGVAMAFDQIDPGTSVRVVYTAVLPNLQPVLPVNTILTWTSLPEDFISWGGDAVGTDSLADGERTGSGLGPNTYVLRTPAGLGQVAGVLWNDTGTATSNPQPDLGAPRIAGQNVLLTWGGLDNDLSTTGDNRVFSVTTDSSGFYRFSLLPSGVFRVTMPTGPILDPNDAAAGLLDVRIDTDGGVLGQVDFVIDTSTAAGTTTVVANAGYVERNDAPTVAVPPTQNGLEDVPLAMPGIVVGDPDANRNPNPPALLTVQLSVNSGTLSLASTPTGVTVGGSNTATLVLTGTITDLNLALAQLTYLGLQDFNGNDLVTVLVNDNGNFGDANVRNGIPGEPADALTVQSTFQIVLAPVNDAPIAADDAAAAVEAGGVNNNQFGFDPFGNVLGNDIDVDLKDTPSTEVLSLTGIARAGEALVAVPAGGQQVVVGLYGTLLVDSDGFARYFLDNGNPAVEALRLSTQTLTESFDYRVTDSGNLSDTARITITIRGANDAPVGNNDSGSAVEAGGVANGTPGSDATGNVLLNDTDVDSVANGESRRVSSVRFGPESIAAPIQSVPPGSNSATGTAVAGLYGTLTLGADGTYRYVVNNGNPTVQALAPGQTLEEVFSYRVADTAGLEDIAELRIVVSGAQDNPVATDNSATAQAAPTDNSQPEINPSGNVITDNNGNGVDSDVDAVDNPNTVLRVGGIRTGAELAGGALTGVATGSTSTGGGTVLQGTYGTLTIGADGSYLYDVDSTNAAVQALRPGASLNDVFTYQLLDTSGLPDLAQLVVRVNGVNDPPVAGNLTADAIEAGGAFNATPGVNPSGNVRTVITDPDGDVPTITFIRPGPEAIPGTDTPVAPTGDTVVAGNYGTLTIHADGSFTYVVNNSNTAVQALRTDTDRLTDNFTYTAFDGVNGSDRGQINVVIHGRNDNPVAANDQAAAVEAGGTLNQTPGVDPTGSVFSNDTDVDANDQLFVVGARTGTEAAGGTFTGMLTGASITIQGTYGRLVIFENGNFQYLVDNNNAQVQALRPGQTLSESFTYAVRDLASGTDFAQIDLTVGGAWDAPVAQDNYAYAVADNPLRAGTNPTGNLITDNNILGIPYPADSDVDNGDVLTVNNVRAGPESDGPGGMTAVPAGSTVANGVRITGQYGWLTVGADGSYLYEVDSLNPTILALGPLGFVTDGFTYSAQDLGGLTDLAQITVLVRGVNQAPIPVPDRGDAVEAGGLQNAVAGTDPSAAAPGVIGNDFDFESDPLFVVGVQPGDAGGGVPNTGVGTQLQGLYGTLTMQRDGAWTYVVDNDSPEVEALRQSGQTLQDVFTYTVTDIYGARSTSTLTLVIDGRNDDPIASDDGATAVEAGGVFNATPGVDPRGNVLDNDTDVDSVALGETKQVLEFSSSNGQGGVAGATVQGLYGTLQLNADGSYVYTVDNDNPTVQALRTAGETLTEVFVYTMRDTADARSTARLTITLQGANDNPVARDDSTGATDQVPPPQTTGNVLPNDSDVDGGEALQVVAIRAGAASGTGAAGSLDQPLAGRYGTLVIHADGSYTYTIDQTNPEVLAAAGMGQVLNDYFTYTVADRAGATDLAQLVIKLDIAAPYVGPEGDQIFADLGRPVDRFEPLPQVQPAVFVEPVVRQVAAGLEISSWGTDGTQTLQQLPRENASPSIGAGLLETPGQFVARAVAESRIDREFSLARMSGRESRIDLSADGLLSDPSIFTINPQDMFASWSDPAGQDTADAAEPLPLSASSFSEQLRAAAREREAWTMAGLGPAPEAPRPR